MDKVNSGSVFVINEKRDENKMFPNRMRRSPRGKYCISHQWHEDVEYVIDNERSNNRFMMFKSPKGYKYYWWIDKQTNQICYDASSSLKNYVERDDINEFVFTIKKN